MLGPVLRLVVSYLILAQFLLRVRGNAFERKTHLVVVVEAASNVIPNSFYLSRHLEDAGSGPNFGRFRGRESVSVHICAPSTREHTLDFSHVHERT